MTSGIIEILIEAPAVTSLVGTEPGGHIKIYPTQAPQNVKTPYITVSETSLNPSIAKGCPSDLDKPRYNVLVYSLDFRETELIQEACRITLDTGAGFTTDAGASFDAIWMSDRQDLYMASQGQDPGIFVKAGVYECQVRRSIS